jgi:hypothetical protein
MYPRHTLGTALEREWPMQGIIITPHLDRRFSPARNGRAKILGGQGQVVPWMSIMIDRSSSETVRLKRQQGFVRYHQSNTKVIVSFYRFLSHASNNKKINKTVSFRIHPPLALVSTRSFGLSVS